MTPPYRLTTAQAADALGVSPDQVLVYVREGKLTARTDREGGRRLYFLPAELQAFCAAMPVVARDTATDAPRRTLRRIGQKSA